MTLPGIEPWSLRPLVNNNYYRNGLKQVGSGLEERYLFLSCFPRPRTDLKPNGSQLQLAYLQLGNDVIDKYSIALDSQV